MKFGRLEVVAEEEKRRRKVDVGKSTSESLNSEAGERGYSQVPKPGGAAVVIVGEEEEEDGSRLSTGAWRSRWKENMVGCVCAREVLVGEGLKT